MTEAHKLTELVTRLSEPTEEMLTAGAFALAHIVQGQPYRQQAETAWEAMVDRSPLTAEVARLTAELAEVREVDDRALNGVILDVLNVLKRLGIDNPTALDAATNIVRAAHALGEHQ